MTADSARTLAFEFLSGPRVIVMCQTASSPTDAEWQGYLDCVSSLATTETIKVLVQTEGGRPSPQQQQRLVACVGERDMHTAVVSPAVAIRFVVSSLSLSKRNVRYFEPSEMAAAFEHLQLDTTTRAQVQHALQRLQAALVSS